MATDPPETLRLTPFLEPQDPDYPESPLFVAGFLRQFASHARGR